MGMQLTISFKNREPYDFFVLEDERFLDRFEHILDTVEHLIPYDSWTWKMQLMCYGTCRFIDEANNLYDVCYSPESRTFHIISVPVR